MALLSLLGLKTYMYTNKEPIWNYACGSIKHKQISEILRPVAKLIIIIMNMLIVQYPIQFSELFRNVSNPCSVPLCAGKWWFN